MNTEMVPFDRDSAYQGQILPVYGDILPFIASEGWPEVVRWVVPEAREPKPGTAEERWVAIPWALLIDKTKENLLGRLRRLKPPADPELAAEFTRACKVTVAMPNIWDNLAINCLPKELPEDFRAIRREALETLRCWFTINLVKMLQPQGYRLCLHLIDKEKRYRQ